MAKSKYIEALEEQYTKKDAKSVLRYKAPDNKWRYVQTSKDASGGNMPSGGMEEVTWQELKDKRDAGKLTPGSLYRITDYNCTTTQENTRSAGHQFDIVLLALSEDKLAEEGWAMEHPTDVYDVTFMDGVTKKCYLYYTDADYCNLVLVDSLLGCSEIEKQQLVIDNVNKTISTDVYSLSDLNEENLTYNYFQNSNLSAWKVWYCLDNDTARFAWADDSVNGEPLSVIVSGTFSGMYSEDIKCKRNPLKDVTFEGVHYFNFDGNRPGPTVNIYTETLDINSETKWYGLAFKGNIPTSKEELNDVVVSSVIPSTETPNGRGVIYRLIDEFNNDCPYDFKNIQFVRKLTDGVLDTSTGTNTYVYTFNLWYQDECVDGTVVGNTIIGDEDVVVGVKNNYFGSVDVSAAIGSQKGNINCPCLGLGNNVILSTCEGDWFYGASGNIITDNSRGCTLSGEETNVDNREIYAGVGCFLDAGASDAVARHCMDTTITAYNVIAIRCDSDTITEQGIYFMSKKVLTES